MIVRTADGSPAFTAEELKIARRKLSKAENKEAFLDFMDDYFPVIVMGVTVTLGIFTIGNLPQILEAITSTMLN